MAADVVISASDVNTLADGSPLPRLRMFEALIVPGVAAATPLYYGKIDWQDAEGATRTLDVLGVDPSARTFDNPDVAARLAELTVADTALLDRATRNAPPELFGAIDAGEPYGLEAQGRTLTVVGAFTIDVAMGVIVGLIIAYQVLSTDVADHMREYATLKAIGCGQSFFLGIVFEEAIVLAIPGFLPAVPIALGACAGVSAAASLPVAMTPLRPVYVLAGTVATCALSGAIATRRLARADPADLF